MSGSHSGAYGIRRCKAGDQQASTRNKTIIKDKHPSLIYLESRGRSRPRLLPSSGLLLIECCRVDAGFNGRRIIFSKLSYILLMAGGKDKGAGESKVKDPVSVSIS